MTTAELDKPQVVSVVRAGRLLGLGRTASYEAARRGDLPVIRIGRRYVVPLRALEKMLDGAAPRSRDDGAER